MHCPNLVHETTGFLHVLLCMYVMYEGIRGHVVELLIVIIEVQNSGTAELTQKCGGTIKLINPFLL